MSDESPDQRYAKQLGGTADEVRMVRDHFATSREGEIMRHIFSDRIQQMLTEQTRKLISDDEDEFRRTQGQIRALEQVLKQIKLS